MTSLDMNDSLQENLLVLLCCDDEAAKLISSVVNVGLFGNKYYRKIATACYSYTRLTKQAINIHLYDEFEDIIRNDDDGKIYKRIIDNIFIAKEQVNKEYTVQKIQRFINQKELMKILMDAHHLMESDRLDEAQKMIEGFRGSTLQSFDFGLKFGVDSEAIFNFIEDQGDTWFMSGLVPLDKLGVRPGRKKLFVVVANPGVGKSWYCIHMAKINSLAGYKVLFVTLEMSKESVSQRFIQAFYSVAKSRAKFNDYVLNFNPTDNFVATRIDEGRLDYMEDAYFLDSEKHRDIIKKDMEEYRDRFNRGLIVIKEFPDNTLTDYELELFLDRLLSIDKFQPDILFVDYPEKMKLNADNYRISLGRTNLNLLRIAKERNMGLIIPFQGNRKADDRVIWITDKFLSEDYSIFKHADVMISLNQVPAEQALGIVRPFVMKCREEVSGTRLIMSTNYSIGQSCMSCGILSGSVGNYMDMFRESFNRELIERRSTS